MCPTTTTPPSLPRRAVNAAIVGVAHFISDVRSPTGSEAAPPPGLDRRPRLAALAAVNWFPAQFTAGLSTHSVGRARVYGIFSFPFSPRFFDFAPSPFILKRCSQRFGCLLPWLKQLFGVVLLRLTSSHSITRFSEWLLIYSGGCCCPICWRQMEMKV